jgi:endonuclease-3
LLPRRYGREEPLPLQRSALMIERGCAVAGDLLDDRRFRTGSERDSARARRPTGSALRPKAYSPGIELGGGRIHDPKGSCLRPPQKIACKRMAKIPFPAKKVPRDVAAREMEILERTYPHAVTALEYKNAFELLTAVILSAQTTDARVNMTTPQLFAKYPTPEKLARARPSDVEEIIKSTGFFRTKARNIISCAKDLVEKYNGEVPSDRDALESLAGVGRKTANVVMGVAFGEAALAVDTHVFRVSHRLGLTLGKTPREVENDLTAIVPREKWRLATHWLILHGRQICKAPQPLCGKCPVNELCPTPKIIARYANGQVAATRRRRRSVSAKKKA